MFALPRRRKGNKWDVSLIFLIFIEKPGKGRPYNRIGPVS